MLSSRIAICHAIKKTRLVNLFMFVIIFTSNGVLKVYEPGLFLLSINLHKFYALCYLIREVTNQALLPPSDNIFQLNPGL